MDTVQRDQELERRISYLEHEVKFLKTLVKSPNDATQQNTDIHTKVYTPTQPLRKHVQIPEKIDLEHTIGRIWLPRIFIVILLLGVMYGFIASVQAGIITPAFRCVLGGLVTALFIVLGEKQIKEKRNALGQALLGGAVSIGVITIFAAHMLYDFIPPVPAFILDVGLIVTGVYLSNRHHSEALGILSSVGGYLVPFLISSNHPSTPFFVLYEALSSVAFLIFAMKKKFVYLLYISIACFHLALFAFYAFTRNPISSAIVSGTVTQHLAILLYVIYGKPSEKKQNTILLPSFAITSCWVVSLLTKTDSQWYFIVALIIYFAIFLWLRYPVLSSVATLSLFSYLLTFSTTIEKKSILFFIEGLIAIRLGVQIKSRVQIITGAIPLILGTLGILMIPISEVFSIETLGWILLLLCVYAQKSLFRFQFTQQQVVLIGIFIVRTILTLCFLTEVIQVITENLSIDTQHYSLSFVWALYAIVETLYGRFIQNNTLDRFTGIAILLLTLIKVIFADIPNVSLTIRAILFIVLGFIGLGISRIFYKK